MTSLVYFYLDVIAYATHPRSLVKDFRRKSSR